MNADQYNKCVQEWSDALFRFAVKCTGQTSDAHDVVQGSFEVLCNEWQSGNAILESTSESIAYRILSRPKEKARKFVRTHRWLLAVTRLFRGLELKDQPSHLLWVVKKPS